MTGMEMLGLAALVYVVGGLVIGVLGLGFYLYLIRGAMKGDK